METRPKSGGTHHDLTHEGLRPHHQRHDPSPDPAPVPLTRAELGRAIVKLCAESGFTHVLASFVGPSGYWVTYTAGMEAWGLLKVAELALTDAQRERDAAFNSPPPPVPTGGGVGGNSGGQP